MQMFDPFNDFLQKIKYAIVT